MATPNKRFNLTQRSSVSQVKQTLSLPLAGVFWYLPEPFATWCVKIVAGSAMFSFVSVFVLYPLSERLDRLLGV